jgi:hypothetical protein
MEWMKNADKILAVRKKGNGLDPTDLGSVVNAQVWLVMHRQTTKTVGI